MLLAFDTATQLVSVAIHDGERVLSLSREISESQRLWIKRDGEGYVAEVIDLETQLRTAGAHGVIESSLFEAGSAAGAAR